VSSDATVGSSEVDLASRHERRAIYGALDPETAAWVESTEPISIRRVVGLSYRTLEPGRTVQDLVPTDDVVDEAGHVAVGAVAVLADSSLGTASGTGAGFAGAVTASLQCDLLGPLPAGASLGCTATVVAFDDTSALVTGVLDISGRPLGHVSARFLALDEPGAPSGRAVVRRSAPSVGDPGPGVAGGSIDRLLGMQRIDAGEGRATVQCTARPLLANGLGRLHGGAVAWIGSRAARHAITSAEPDPMPLLELSLDVDFLRPVPVGGLVSAEAAVVSRSRRFVRSDAVLTLDDGRPAARIRLLFGRG
jgi:uncharacterized protein (TIGR00369 family)